MALVVETDRRGAVTIVRLDGELDIYTVPAFTAQTDAAVGDGDVVIDLNGVGLVDSSGLGALLRLTRPHEPGRRVALACRLTWMRRLLALARVEDRFIVRPDVDQAVAALGGSDG